jgi:N-succinyldiaminopimelate aminotransferase
MPRAPRTSPLADGLSDAVFSQLASRARGRGAIALHVGDTYLEPPEVARVEHVEGAHLYAYAPVQGEPALLEAAREFVNRRHGIELDPDALQVVSGATSGLSILSEALLDPGDELLLPAPYWPLIRGIAHKRGVRPVEVPVFDRLGDPSFDLEAELESRITERTAAVYVNSPNNPTGAVLDEPRLAAIARVAARHDLWILCDEVYEDLWLERPAPPTWSRPDFVERAVVVHSASKAYGLAGARVGFAHGPVDAMRAVRSVQTFSTYGAPRLLQRGVARAFAEADGWLASTRATYAAAARRTSEALGVPMPAGGTFCFVDVRARRREGESTLALLERCLDAGVLLTPGSASGRDYEGWVRLCFTVVPPAELERALGALADVLGAPR